MFYGRCLVRHSIPPSSITSKINIHHSSIVNQMPHTTNAFNRLRPGTLALVRPHRTHPEQDRLARRQTFEFDRAGSAVGAVVPGCSIVYGIFRAIGAHPIGFHHLERKDCFSTNAPAQRLQAFPYTRLHSMIPYLSSFFCLLNLVA